MVEKAQLEQILKELNLQSSDLYEQKNAVKLGRLLAARGIIVGSVTLMNENIVIQARLVDLQSGEIIRSSKAETPRNQNISRACAKVAYDLINLPYNDNIVDGEVFLDFDGWEKYLLGVTFSAGITRQVQKGNKDITNVVRFELDLSFQISTRFKFYFSKISKFGLLFDLGWHRYSPYEQSHGQNWNTLFIQNKFKLDYLYLTIAPILRLREFYIFLGPYFGYLINSKVIESTISHPEIGFIVSFNDRNDIFSKFDMGLHFGFGSIIKNLPAKIKLTIGIEFKLQLKSSIDDDLLNKLYNKSVISFALYFNMGLLFGL